MDRKYQKGIGDRIRNLRIQKGMTQKQLADIPTLRVQRNLVNYWENEERDIKSDQIIALADFFGVTCDEILRGVKADNLDINKQLGLSDKAIEALTDMKRHIEGPYEMEDKLNGRPIRTTFNGVSYPDTEIVNYLLENYIERINNGTNDSIIQILRRYFAYRPSDDQVVALLEHGGAAIRPKGEHWKEGARFAAEQLGDLFLLLLQVRLKEYRGDFISKERGDTTNANQAK